jgi:tRNA pseudouridine55 synthase
MNGLVLIDKPRGLTSHDVVNHWRKLAMTKRTGHLGTLDPMATGLLVLLTGNITRLARFFERHDKAYEAIVTLGCVSNTYDADGEIERTGTALPSAQAVEDAVAQFRGLIQQVPPPVSAKKIAGVRAYRLARQGQPLELAAVPVEVKKLEHRMLTPDTLHLYVACSAGTYIRSLAHDLGRTLGCGAILSGLRRVTSGPFNVDQARTLDELTKMSHAGVLHDAILAPTEILPEMPAVYIDSVEEARIRQGRDFHASPFVVKPGTPRVKALSHSGELVSIGELKYPNVYHPAIVL